MLSLTHTLRLRVQLFPFVSNFDTPLFGRAESLNLFSVNPLWWYNESNRLNRRRLELKYIQFVLASIGKKAGITHGRDYFSTVYWAVLYGLCDAVCANTLIRYELDLLLRTQVRFLIWLLTVTSRLTYLYRPEFDGLNHLFASSSYTVLSILPQNGVFHFHLLGQWSNRVTATICLG